MFNSIQQKLYRGRHREAFRLRSSKYYLRLKTEMVRLFGGKCTQCGISDIRVLCLHHKNGGGNLDREVKNGHVASTTFYRRILDGKREIKDLELLCMNCHSILHSKLPVNSGTITS